MLKEYEKTYDIFKIHYDSSEKTFKLYLVIVGALITILSYVYKDSFESVRLFNFNQLICFMIFLTSISGSFLYMMVVEHRIKTVFYVHNLNSIRNWFTTNTTSDIGSYLLLPSDNTIPKYFILCKDFFWEISVFAVLNSTFLTIGIMNILRYLQPDCFIKYNACHYIMFSLIAIILFVIHIYSYKLRGKKQLV